MKERTVRVIRWSLLRLLTLGALAETIWTIYVGYELPRHYVANHWDIAWVGLDVAQVIMLSASAWAAWRRNTLLVIFATASATLLLVDAWFDVTTARRGDLGQGMLLAGLVEAPSAFILLWVAYRGLRHAVLLPIGEPGVASRSKTFDTREPFD
ncbi:MAG: hypothetical protein HKL85_00395 [Acidimicrobiaceae bacterium]|nr:hypothetical protein [Acidimicrobiaceae bacterium]